MHLQAITMHLQAITMHLQAINMHLHATTIHLQATTIYESECANGSHTVYEVLNIISFLDYFTCSVFQHSWIVYMKDLWIS